jgi:DNA-binding PadR family transcriptional regulator
MAAKKARAQAAMDFNECACSGRSLVRLVRPAVLGLLAGAPLHGYRLLQRMRALAMFRDQPPDATGLYRLLKIMEDEGLIASSWDAGKAGPARRRYELTPRGRSCLVQWNRTLVRYLRSVAELLDLTAGDAREDT